MRVENPSCQVCAKVLVLGVVGVERFYPTKASDDGNLDTGLVWHFHRKPCFELFMKNLEATRDAAFIKDTAANRGRGGPGIPRPRMPQVSN